MTSAKLIIPTALSYNKKEFVFWVKKLEPFFKSIHLDIVDSSYGRESWFDEFITFDYLKSFNKIIIHLMVSDPFDFLFNKSKYLKKKNTIYLLRYSSLGENIKNKLMRLKSLDFNLGLFFNLTDSMDLPLEHLQYFSEFMFMCVKAGKSGSKYNPKGLKNLDDFIKKYDNFLLDTTLSVDGGFNELTYQEFLSSKAYVIYTNSFLKKNGPKEALNKLSILANQCSSKN